MGAMEQLARDVRVALRSLLARPATSMLAAAALALGIGLTTAMFCIVDGVFLRGLPFERADRLLYVGQQDSRLADRRPRDVPMNDYLEWRAGQRAFEDLAAFIETGADVAGEGITPRQYEAARIEPSLLGLLRIAPAIGRAFTLADAAEGAPPVALISDTAWRRQFDANPDVVGRTIRVDRAPVTVVGVMPPGFGFPHDAHVWLPLPTRAMPTRAGNQPVHVLGRLRDGVGAGEANAEFRALTAALAARESLPNLTAVAMPFVERFMSREITVALTLMLVAVFGVLLIACVNVTNLVLARAAERVREVGIRLAIGASRARVIRQFLIEGALVASAGAAAGIGIAFAGVAFFGATMADSTPPFWVDVRVDGRVLLFTCALTGFAAVASSLAPAVRASRIGIHGVLNEAGRSTAGLRMVRFSRALVVAEITLSFALLLASGLMIKSVMVVGRLDMPFRTDLFHARVSFPARPYADPQSAWQAGERLLELLTAEPGILGAAATTALPDNAGAEAVTIDGAPAPGAGEQRPRARRLGVSPDFFSVMATGITRGRTFDARDRAGQPPVAIVTAEFAQRFFPGGDALGRRIQLGTDRAAPWRTIVGVVPRLVVANTTSTTTPSDAVLLPLAQAPSRRIALLVSAVGDPAAALPAVLRAARRLDPDLPLSQTTTVASLYHDQSWPIRLFGSLFASFGAAALLLSTAGLYGVMAFGVRSRRQEFGVRMALGADRSGILWLVLRQGTRLVAIGLALGLGIGGWLSGQMQLFLFGVTPWDPGIFTAIAVVLAATGLTAAAVPAWRAASIDPAVALRDQ